MNHNKALNLLGFDQRAGKIISGEACTAFIKQKKVFLIILAQDASDNTKNQIIPLCRQYKIPFLELGSKIDLGISIGKSPRAVIGVLEKNFADAIWKTFY